MKVDLHLHSNNSDGSDSVQILYNEICNAKLNVFALTDHDTISGLEEMENLISSNIKFIKGVELTSLCNDIKCHLLGYGVDYNNLELKNLIEKGKLLRRQKLETRIDYLKNTWNIEFTEEEKQWLYSRKSVVKTHVANVLVKRGLAKDNLSAMQKYLDACKTGNTRFSGEEAISAIKNSGGIVVWAHPLGGEGEVHLTKEKFIPKLEKMLDFGIQGLECFYSRYNEEESLFLFECTQKYNLFASAGSDYHGANKSNIEIGKLNCDNKTIDPKKITILNNLLEK